ncbi:MAG: TonB-dependent receptor [Vicinamibacterales bacterium]
MTFRPVTCVTLAAALATVPALAAGQSTAQSTQQPRPTVEERIEVVATKLPEAPAEVPAAIEVITGEELRARGVTTLREALLLSPGIEIAPGGDGGPASSVPEFRGLREFDAFLLVVDDVPWGGAFNPALSTLDMTDVERIEVLRGPAPVTYGATSFVGVIHVVHKRGAASGPTASVHGGTWGSGGGSITSAIPFLGGWDARISASGERRGFSDDRTSFVRGHGSLRASRTSDAGRMWFNADVAITNQDPNSPHPRDGRALSTVVPVDANHQPAGAFLDDHRFTGDFGIERQLGAKSWTTTLSVSRATHDILRGFLLDYDETHDNARGLRETIELTDVYADSHLAVPVSGAVTLVAGADYLHGSGDAHGGVFDYSTPVNGALAVGVRVPSPLPVEIDAKRDFVGGYLSSEWRPTGRLRIDAGVRLNITREEIERGDEAERAREAAGGGEDAGEQVHTRPSGSLGLIYTAWTRDEDAVRVYANYRDTFKPAAFDFGVAEEEGGEDGEGLLDPETSRSYEGGVKARLWHGRADVDVVAFLMDFENLVVAQTVNGLPALTNAGTERFKGLEAGTSFFLPHHVTARANYSFHDARFREYVRDFDGVPFDLAGKRLELSARHLGSAGLLYYPPQGVLAQVEMNYVGSRFLDKRNRALADGFATLHASAGYRTSRWEIRLEGHNLTDERAPIAESELGDAQYYLMPARWADVVFTVRF